MFGDLHDISSVPSNGPVPSITSVPSPALATEQRIVASASVDPPAKIVPITSVEPSATSADPSSTADSSSTVNLSSSTSVDPIANIVPSTSVDPSATSADPLSTIDTSSTHTTTIDTVSPPTSVDAAVPNLRTPPTLNSPHSSSVDASGSTPLTIDPPAEAKKRKHSESQENSLLAPKTRKRAKASGVEDQGRGAGRVTRASMKQAEEQAQTSRTLRGARQGNVAGGKSAQVNKRKGRR
ncbi:hypothetical protein EV360DRAFT_87833 [Lentinula raphanica]|nr:hypothetical protein EV360DRAFT_87833 [Lentinula raphanica]